jgi:hypothetical protein
MIIEKNFIGQTKEKFKQDFYAKLTERKEDILDLFSSNVIVDKEFIDNYFSSQISSCIYHKNQNNNTREEAKKLKKLIKNVFSISEKLYVNINIKDSFKFDKLFCLDKLHDYFTFVCLVDNIILTNSENILKNYSNENIDMETHFEAVQNELNNINTIPYILEYFESKNFFKHVPNSLENIHYYKFFIEELDIIIKKYITKFEVLLNKDNIGFLNQTDNLDLLIKSIKHTLEVSKVVIETLKSNLKIVYLKKSAEKPKVKKSESFLRNNIKFFNFFCFAASLVLLTFFFIKGYTALTFLLTIVISFLVGMKFNNDYEVTITNGK